MKIRWREHESSLVINIALFIIVGYVWQMFKLSPQQIENEYATAFVKQHITFNYYTRVLLPQIASVLILLAAYFWINRLIIPQLVSAKNIFFGLITSALQLIVVIYLIGPGINFVSFYANPYFHAPAGAIDVPLTFGFHPQPLLNLFGGFNVACFMVLLVSAYLLFRETVIQYYQKLKEQQQYQIMILNQITIFLVPFFMLPVAISVFKMFPDGNYLSYYYAFTLAAFATFVSNTFWLFPQNEGKLFITWKFAGPLLFSTFIYTFFFSIALGSDWTWYKVLGEWIGCLVLISPMSWIDYKQRKEKILQLRGVEKALVKSTADLQFLRSQINPHFLFNALNTLYGTALIEGSKNTAEGIQKLGDMMRFMLHENTQDFIPMNSEIEYLKNYISLQKLRTQTSPDLLIEDNITGQDCSHLIAPMLLIPFVENAFKHGISFTEKSWIKIELECNPDHIIFEVTNNVHQSIYNNPERENSGIGLKNVEQRLKILYKGKYEFTHGITGNEYIVKLKIAPISGKLLRKQVNLNWIKKHA